MCSHTYTCISDTPPPTFPHRNTLKKFIKILQAYNKLFICILPLIDMENTQKKYKSIEIALKYTKMTKSKKMS